MRFPQPSTVNPQPSSRPGFTLVELLVVIVIIGILAGLTVGAVQMAQTTARRAVIKSEITQLTYALERYKTEVGEYPPDFTCLNTDNDPTVDTPAETAAKVVLTRHLRRRFPRYAGDWDLVVADVAANYGGVDITQLDPASALVFWLGGLPETAASVRPAGFHADPEQPFQPGLPRTQPYYDFDPERLVGAVAGILRYHYHPNLPAGIPAVPYVYFRAQRAPDNSHTYEFIERHPTNATLYIAAVRDWHDAANAAVGRAVPYRDGAATDPNSLWRNESTYQILAAGLDGTYGGHPDPIITVGSPNSAVPATPLPGQQFTTTYPSPRTRTAANFAADGGDFDNMANFAEGKLEDELQ